MNWIFVVILAMFLLVGILALIGRTLPETHVARRRLTLPRSPDEVWKVMTDHSGEPAWREELVRVEHYGEDHGRPLWTEHHQRGERRTLLTEESEPPQKLVRSLAVERRAFRATWTYHLEPIESDEGEQTVLTVEERVEISHPVYRILARYIAAHGAFTQQYLTALAKHFGVDASAIEPLPAQRE